MNADGTGERKVVDADAFSVAFSPDGKKLAYASFEGGSNGDVFSVNLDGSSKTRLTTDPGLDAVADFSPGGGKIAFFSNRNSLSGEIFVMNADGSDERILTEGSEASFSPNGKRIVVEVSSGGIAVANAQDASNRVNIMPNSLGNENAPDWGAAPKKRR